MEFYGHFRGTCAVIREYNTRSVHHLTRILKDYMENVQQFLEVHTSMVTKHLIGIAEDERFKNILEIYTEKDVEILTICSKYTGRNPIISHEDC